MYAVRDASLRERRNGFMKARDGVLVEYSYFDRKAETTIAFINGWGTVSFSEWARQVRLADHNLLMHNSRGMGRSGLGSGDYLHNEAGDLGELITHVGAKGVHLVGHSMGGLIGTLFLSRYRNGADIRTMTYVCSPDGDPVETFSLKGILRFDVDRAISSYESGFLGELASLAERSRAAEALAYVATFGGGVRFHRGEFSRLYHNFLAHREAVAKALKSMRENGEEIGGMLKDVDVPALIIAGRYDFLVEYTAAKRMHGEIPQSKLVIFEKSSHAPMFEEPARFNQVLSDFLEYR
ncbi:MAG TPA: alpha/beta hydrolase [Candidatus Bilamarchaeum sp.]|nr:alpha/beta hydrolase [Candidatus Bilamarchaeum sp.]